MQKTEIKKILKSIYSRVGILYVMALLIFYQGTDLYMMKVKTINHVVPQSMSDKVKFSLKPNFNNVEEIQQSIRYHKTVVNIIPDSWADWGFLGFFYFFNNDNVRAKACFLKADSREKDFFWYSYNLGVIYLKEEQYALADKYFSKALSVSFPRTLELMQVYKAYNMLLPTAIKSGYDIELGLYGAVKNAQAMRIKCQYQMPLEKNDARFFLRMF